MIPAEFGKRVNQLGGFCLALAVLFSLSLFRLVQFALADDLFSYILIIPAVSVWLIWQIREELKWEFAAATGVAFLLGVVGIALTMAGLLIRGEDQGATRLALSILGFVTLINAGGFWFLGTKVMRQIAFPACFLVFLTPFPHGMVHGIEVGLQYASAEASSWLFSLTGAAFFRSGLVFQLPGITIEVAPECSGIRSTLVLFMTSLIAGHMFLERGWQRWIFTLLVFPLGIVRNAFRIVTIGWLCIEYGPHMIDSVIHHRGGPFFFGLSLIPLFLLLWAFRRMNQRKTSPPKAEAAGAPSEIAPVA